MIALLRRNRRYARLWAGESISILGDHVTGLAVPMVAILLLRAPVWQVGILTAAGWTPYLGALLIGTLTDRIRTKRRLLIGADLIRAVALLSVPMAFATGALTLAQLVVVAVVVGLAGVVSQTSYTAFLVRIVDPDDIVTANALISTSRSAAALGGPPAAGGLIQLLGAPVALLVDVASYLVSAASLAGLRVAERRVAPTHRRVWHDAADGVRALLRDPWLRSILWCTSTMNLASFAIVAVVLVFASQSLGLSPSAIGIALGLGAVGALTGALLATRIAGRLGLFATVTIGSVLFSGSYLVLGLAPSEASVPVKVAVFAAGEFGVSSGVMLYDILINSVMVKVMPDAMRGRLIGAFSTLNYGIRPLGALIGGFSAQLWGPRWTLLVAAGAGLLAVIPLLRSPLRGCRELADVPEPAPVSVSELSSV